MEFVTEGLVEAASQLGEPRLLLFLALGILNGMVFGLLPGLSGSVGIALMIPLTYGLSLEQAMVLFVAALSGQTFSGSIGAILLKMPGTSPNAATTFDGYPLAQQGRGGFAIGISAMASAMGSLIGVVVLIALLPVVRQTILLFGYPEFTMLGILGLTAIALASRGTLLKGLVAGAFGIMISLVGYSPIGNQLRFVFNIEGLWSGISVVPILIGVFALAEVIRLTVTKSQIARAAPSTTMGRRDVFQGVGYVLRHPVLLIRSAILGTGLGIVPGVGGTVASFLAYFQAQKTCKDGRFGEGDPRGVLAPEAANDGKDAGAALPTLGFGLPGSSDWAIILGAMILHGVAPGPNLIRESPHIIWIAVLVILAASWFTSLAGVMAAPYLVKLTSVRGSIIGPVVAGLAVAGAFALERQMLDVLFAIVAAILGYYMAKNQVPLVPLILGLILGSSVESWYIRSQDLYQEGLGVFITRPISAVLVAGTVLLIVSEIWMARRRSQKLEVSLVDSKPRMSGVVMFGLFAIVGVVAISQASGFNAPANTFPIVIGWVLVILSVMYLAIALHPTLRRRFWPIVGGDAMMGMQSADRDQSDEDTKAGAGGLSVKAENAIQREAWVILSLVGLGVLMWLVGLFIAVPVFMVVAMRWIGRESYRLIGVIVVVTMTLLYAMFVQILGLPISFGIF